MKNKMKYIAIFLVLFAVIVIPLTYSKYIKKYTKQLSISAIQPTYTVIFDPNGGTGTMDAQTFTYKTPQSLSANTFTNGTYVFEKWNTESDGSGDSYGDEEVVDKLTSTNGGSVTLYAIWIDKVAKIGNKYYDSLDEAVDDVYSSDPQTTIVLLKNTNEIIVIPAGVDIILDLNHKTLGNAGNTNVIQNNGTLYLKNGNVTSDASTNGAINNNSTGTMVIDAVNVSVVGTGNRQALYNDKGTATIKGGSVLTSVSTERAAVQNVSRGTITVLDAYIRSTGYHGLYNQGTLTLGASDGQVEVTPEIVGVLNGLNTTQNVNYYDGVLKGVQGAVNDLTKIRNIPSGYVALEDEEDIDGVTYDIRYLSIGVTVTFDANGGSTPEPSRYLGAGRPVGPLPTAVKSGHTFDGWFTAKNGGVQIDENVVIESNITFYAHYTKNKDAATANGVLYDSVQEAIDAIGANTPTTITLLKDAYETITVPSNKDITLDLDTFTLTNAGNTAVITNEGNLTILSGTVRSDTDTATINQNAGVLSISGGNIIATGSRGAIYSTGGTINISGTAYISSAAYGKPTTSNMERGAIQCLVNCTLNITGGTVVATRQQAISNEGTLTIGIKDGNIDTTTPVLQGNTYGVRSSGTFNYYDGVLKGKTDAFDGYTSELEDYSQVVNGTEVIDGDTYITAHLEF